MKWMIGLDLRPEGRGALAFARWIHELTRPGGEPDSFFGVHVVEEYSLLAALKSEELSEVIQTVRARAVSEINSALAHDLIEVPHILEGVDADAGLVDAAVTHDADALVLGRKALAADDRWVRLGRVARRILRTLPVPTVIVPPDFLPDRVGPGPILLATDLETDSTGPVRFARQMAETLKRPLAVLHVLPTFDAGASYVPAATVEQLYHQLGLEREKSLESWKHEHGLSDAPTVLATGDVVGRTVAIAREERSPLVVCGSRRMSAVERVFSASVGSSLAAYCSCPVAVVPPA